MKQIPSTTTPLANLPVIGRMAARLLPAAPAPPSAPRPAHDTPPSSVLL